MNGVIMGCAAARRGWTMRILALRRPLDRIAGDDRLLAAAVDQLFGRKGLDPATRTAPAAAPLGATA